MASRRTATLGLLAAATLAPIALWSVVPLGASGQSQTQTEQRIDRSKQREQSLENAAARLAELERTAERGIAVLQRRQSQAQQQLDRAQSKLDRTESGLEATRRRLADQQRRLRRDRSVLAANLRGSYMEEPPDLVTVILEADGFPDLIERVEYERETRQANARILDGVRDARRRTARTERSLQKIVPAQRRETAEVRSERNAIASRAGALQERRAALASARAARLAAARSARAGRARAQRTLRRLIAEQEKAATNKAGPGGPWAIPWAIVQCESGGQNVPPNSAGASGYYQFIVSTWKSLGGSTPHAYLAGKAEQDRLAAKLWNDGAGAGNWDCAAIVGLG